MPLIREVAVPGPGQCLLHNIGGRLFVERADAQVAIATAMLAQIRSGHGHPDCRLDGDVLSIAAANQHVAYRLEACGQPGYLLGTLC